MPRTVSINWDSFKFGEDSTAIVTDVDRGFASLLVNASCDAGMLSPRDGCSVYGFATSIWWLGEFQTARGGFVLAVDNGDLYAFRNGAPLLLVPNFHTTKQELSVVRIGLCALLVSEIAEAIVLQYDEVSDSLAVYNSNIQRPITTVSGWIDNSATKPEGSLFSPYTERIMAVTYIRHGETYKFSDISLKDGYVSPFAESYENPNERFSPTWVGEGAPAGTENESLYFSTEGAGALVIRNQFTIPPDCTHVRIYSTLGVDLSITNGNRGKAREAAAGLELRWCGDFSVSKNPPGSLLVIPGSDGYLSGQTHLVQTTGSDYVPNGKKSFFSGGRVWVGGNSLGNPGRWYHSSIVDGSSNPMVSLTTFDLANGYVDTSIDDSEVSVDAGMSHGNIVFLNSKSVYVLQNSDPAYAPILISDKVGCLGGVTTINQQVFFISTDGPAAVSDSVVETLKWFRCGEAWPSGSFHNGRKIRGAYHGQSWVLSDGIDIICCKITEDSRGGWRIEFADGSNVGHGLFCYPNKDTCVISSVDGKQMSRLFDRNSFTDCGYYFTVTIKTSGRKLPENILLGEAYTLRHDIRFNDAGELLTTLEAQFGRIASLYRFNKSVTTGSPVADDSHRMLVEQAFRSDLIGYWFSCGVSKVIRSKGNLFGRLELRLVPRNGSSCEYISVTEDENIPVDVLDSGLSPFDEDFGETNG